MLRRAARAEFRGRLAQKRVQGFSDESLRVELNRPLAYRSRFAGKSEVGRRFRV